VARSIELREASTVSSRMARPTGICLELVTGLVEPLLAGVELEGSFSIVVRLVDGQHRRAADGVLVASRTATS